MKSIVVLDPAEERGFTAENVIEYKEKWKVRVITVYEDKPKRA